jgi:hypothetical protein
VGDERLEVPGAGHEGYGAEDLELEGPLDSGVRGRLGGEAGAEAGVGED